MCVCVGGGGAADVCVCACVRACAPYIFDVLRTCHMTLLEAFCHIELLYKIHIAMTGVFVCLFL